MTWHLPKLVFFFVFILVTSCIIDTLVTNWKFIDKLPFQTFKYQWLGGTFSYGFFILILLIQTLEYTFCIYIRFVISTLRERTMGNLVYMFVNIHQHLYFLIHIHICAKGCLDLNLINFPKFHIIQKKKKKKKKKEKYNWKEIDQLLLPFRFYGRGM